MSPIDAYLAELGAALGDRLPPSVRASRLREARAHLLASAEEIGEADAIRRYGRFRTVANDLVRGHRGYSAQSSWSLSLALCAGFLPAAIGHLLYEELDQSGRWPWFLPISQTWLLLLFVGFFVRIVQTRRWLAGPMASSHIAAFILTLTIRHTLPQKVYQSELRDGVIQSRRLSAEEAKRFFDQQPTARRAPGVTVGEALGVARNAAFVAAAWTVVNAAALGMGALLERRRVRRWRNAR